MYFIMSKIKACKKKVQFQLHWCTVEFIVLIVWYDKNNYYCYVSISNCIESLHKNFLISFCVFVWCKRNSQKVIAGALFFRAVTTLCAGKSQFGFVCNILWDISPNGTNFSKIFAENEREGATDPFKNNWNILQSQFTEIWENCYFLQSPGWKGGWVIHQNSYLA